MYQRRIKRKPEEKTFYLITNRVSGGSFIFGDLEKEYFRKLLFDGQKRYGLFLDIVRSTRPNKPEPGMRSIA